MNPTRPLSIAIVASALALGSWSGRAHACSQFPPQPAIFEPVFDAPALVVESSEIELSCKSKQRLVCTFDAHYHVRNTSGQRLTATVALMLAPADRQVLAEGPGGLKPVQTVVADGWARLVRYRDDDLMDQVGRDSKARTFPWTIDAGALRDIVVRGEAEVGAFREVFGPGCEPEPITMRHPVAGLGDGSRSYGIRLFIAPGIHPNRTSVMRLRIRHPESLALRVERADDPPGGVRITSHAHRGESLAEAAVEFSSHSFVSVGLYSPRSSFFLGGPYLGALLASGPQSGARMRLGYEVAAPHWLVYSLSAESDLRKHSAYVPAVDRMANSWHVAYSYGLGTPVQILPVRRVGIRAQTSASYDTFGLRAAVDLYPGTSTLAASMQASLGAQVSF